MDAALFFLVFFLGQHQRWVSTQTEWKKQREDEGIRVISHMSVLAPGCPQSNPHHYAFMPDLYDVGDVAVSFPSALQDRKQRGGSCYKPVLEL